MGFEDFEVTIHLCKSLKQQLHGIFHDGVISVTESQTKALKDIAVRFDELGLAKTAQILQEFLQSSKKKDRTKCLLKLYSALRLLERLVSMRFAIETIKGG